MKRIFMGLLIFVMAQTLISCGRPSVDFSTLHVDLSNASFLGIGEAIDNVYTNTTSVHASSITRKVVSIDEDGNVEVLKFYNEEDKEVKIEMHVIDLIAFEEYTLIFFDEEYDESAINDIKQNASMQGDYSTKNYFYREMPLHESQKGMNYYTELLAHYIHSETSDIILVHNESGKIFDFKTPMIESLIIEKDGETYYGGLDVSNVSNENLYFTYYNVNGYHFDTYTYNPVTEELDVTNFTTEVEIDGIAITNQGHLIYEYNQERKAMLNDYETFVDLQSQLRTRIITTDTKTFFVYDSYIDIYSTGMNKIGETPMDSQASEFDLLTVVDNTALFMDFQYMFAMDLETYEFTDLYEYVEHDFIGYLPTNNDIYTIYDGAIYKTSLETLTSEEIYSGTLSFTMEDSQQIIDSYLHFSLVNDLNTTDVSINLNTGEVYEGETNLPVIEITSLQPIN